MLSDTEMENSAHYERLRLKWQKRFLESGTKSQPRKIRQASGLKKQQAKEGRTAMSNSIHRRTYRPSRCRRTGIEVENGTNYAVGVLEDGVIRLGDYSYRSPDEARQAWPQLGVVVVEGMSQS